jgi:SagB-type dehydrogenase family enzyme
MTAETDPDSAAATLRGVVYSNSFRSLESAARSSGFRTHPLRYDALREIPTRVAEDFLVNSRLRRRDIELEASVGSYFTEVGGALVSLVGQEGRRGRRAVALPESIPLRMELAEVVRRRRSVRAYTGDPLPLAYLATIVRAACGVTGYARAVTGEGAIPLRSAPSAGGLYPVELHVASLSVDDLERGVFVFDPRRDELWQTSDAVAVEGLLGAMAAPEEILMTSAASAIILLIARPWRSMRKYGSRGMRHVFHEAGAIAQQINLSTVALGFGSVDCASFYDDEVHEALGIDGLYETLVHAVLVGAAP